MADADSFAAPVKDGMAKKPAKPKKQPDKPKLLTPEERWEQGLDHDMRSEEIYRFIAWMDFEHNSDRFCWKSGGDGDNGEDLMYLLDAYFEAKDRKLSLPPKR